MSHHGSLPDRRSPCPSLPRTSLVSREEVEAQHARHSGDPGVVTSTSASYMTYDGDENALQKTLSASTATSLPTLGWKERIRHFTWTWFTLSQATSGIANVLYTVPYRFHGLYHIGCAFFLFGMTLFLFNCIMMILRAVWWPRSFKASFVHPTESLFIPAFFISFGSLLDNICQYGLHQGKTGPWLLQTLIVLFWVYIVLSIAASTGIYLLMWSTQVFTIGAMTPAWVFPAYPMLLVAPIAASLTSPDGGAQGMDAVRIITGGTMVQGAGYCVSFMIYSAFLYRLMTQKLPVESSRPSMFISVGPSAFTVSGLIHMANHFPLALHSDFQGDKAIVGQVVKIMGYWTGFWLYGIAVWFFVIAVGAHWSCVRDGKRLGFSMTWTAFIFPNAALITSTFAVGQALDDNRPIYFVGCVMACCLVAAWFLVMGMLVRAVVTRAILWPQKQEDRDYDAWKSELKAARLRGARAAEQDVEMAAATSAGARGRRHRGRAWAVARHLAP